MIVGNLVESNFLNCLFHIGYSNVTLNTTNGGRRLPSAVAARMTVQLDDSIPGWRGTQLVFLSVTWLKWKDISSIAPTWKAGNCFSRWSWTRTDLNVATLASRCGGSLQANVPSLERNSLCLLQNLQNLHGLILHLKLTKNIPKCPSWWCLETWVLLLDQRQAICLKVLSIHRQVSIKSGQNPFYNLIIIGIPKLDLEALGPSFKPSIATFHVVVAICQV